MTGTAHRTIAVLALLLALAVALAIGWTGFIASDDSLYYAGAVHWLSGPFPGDTHWSTRFPLIWTFATMLAVFGRGFMAFAATALFWYAILVALAGLFARRMAGDRAGWIAALLVGTMPVVIANATTVSIDLMESSALLGGAWLLGTAAPGRAGLRNGLLAGLCCGAAVLGRETAILSIAGLGALFVLGRPVRRDVLVAAGLGMALVLGAEALFQYAMTGEPLRRYDIAFHHDEHIDRAANLEGNFLVHPAIDPLLVLLINDDFGLLFWALIAAGIAAWRKRNSWPPAMAVLGAMALTAFALVAVLTTKLVINPRYFMAPAMFDAIAVAIWLDGARPRLRWGMLGLLVAVNAAFLVVNNRHPRWEVEALVMVCEAHPAETIGADPVTVRRAAIPLEFAHLANAHEGMAVAPGGLVLVPATAVAPGVVVARYPSPPTLAGAVLRSAGMERFVPGGIRRRLFSPSPDYLLVRTPR
jgi:4-amino-4-deoxy-L-arabinose transferase-like glycosyltransferase